MDYKKVINDITSKKFSPVYFIYGEEDYFIDKIANALEENVLTEAEKSFNQAIFYGNEVNAQKLLASLQRYPVMAAHQLVMLKEAQRFGSKELEKMENYFDHPMKSTVFVMLHRGTADKRKTIYKKILDASLKFESKPVKENEMEQWITELAKEEKLTLTPSAVRLLIEYTGTDLAKTDAELQKIKIAGGEGAVITEKEIEMHTGMSREFNVFELTKAVGRKDIYKSNLILERILLHKKDNTAIPAVAVLFLYFQKLWMMKRARTTNEFALMKAIGVWREILPDYLEGNRNFTEEKIIQNLSHLLQADLQLKGITGTGGEDEHTMKVLMYQLLH